MLIDTPDGHFETHTINVANTLVWYGLPYIDIPSYSYWMVPGTWAD